LPGPAVTSSRTVDKPSLGTAYFPKRGETVTVGLSDAPAPTAKTFVTIPERAPRQVEAIA